MKKYAIAVALLVALSASAQKDELKALRKIAEKEAMPTPKDIQDFKALLDKAEPLMGSATNEQNIEFAYYKGIYAFMGVMMNPATAKQSVSDAVVNFNKVIELEKNDKKKKYTKEIQEEIYPQVKTLATGVAQQLGQQKSFKEAAGYYHMAYLIDPKDQSMLYNAAVYAVNAKDYDTALEYYLELDKIGFTGEGTNYSAKNVQTGQREYFPSKSVRDISVQQKLHSEPKDEKLPSLKGDIVKNIALIYSHKGEIDKAKAAMSNARKANPNDISLLIAEADLYLKTKDMDMYKKLISEAVQKNPTNADLFYNLGVVSSETNPAEAKANYEKALAINPKHVNANVNMGILTMADDEKIVTEMNNTKSDKRYEELKQQRNAMFRKALPYFEKALAVEPNNEYAISVAAGVYQALDMPEKAKEIKARLKN